MVYTGGSMKTGAVIAAAGVQNNIEQFRPMLKVGNSTIIHKAIDTLRKADVSPIIVITGYKSDELEKHLSHRGVICIFNKEYKTSQMFDSLKLGLDYIRELCDRVLVVPADTAMFSMESVVEVMNTEGAMVAPMFGDKPGHPVLIESSYIPDIISYDGDDGLRGAMRSLEADITFVQLNDRGLVLDVNTTKEYEEVLEYDKNSKDSIPLDFDIDISIIKNGTFFDMRACKLLRDIEQTQSILASCQNLGISYSKAWKTIREAEDQLGCTLLLRRAGGSGGGNSILTESGKEFLSKYESFYSDVNRSARAFFAMYFKEL